MNWLNEYKKSLKNIEAEEPLDIFFYRPLAFVIVKALYSLPLTPNHYSLMALISGILSGYYFNLGSEKGFVWGAFYFLLFAVLDCCDGMVARLKKNGTEFGRLVDGVVDYTVNIIVYFALAFGVKKYYPESSTDLIAPWILVVIAGVSKAIHSITYDHYLTEYLSYEKGNGAFATNELEMLKQKLKIAHEAKASVKAFALKLYIGYTKLQAGNSKKVLTYNAKEYLQNNLKTLRMWGIVGPTMHITFLILAFLLNVPNVYFGYAIVFGNVWLIFMFLFQRKVNSGLKRELA
jgi:phosphatidylglycerophosphate synthase